MKEIKNREDIVFLVDQFYQQVQKNKILGHIFNHVAKVHWETHLPKMYSFWASILLGEQSYSDNPMLKHIALHQRSPLTGIEFEEWLKLFTNTVDLHFEGENADLAKKRARDIAALMLYKIQNS
ncbi:MAG: group III truncated hemoglobin [Saprospiraceae bacterium]|nr:group III truncated hemoglobin [Saprospiraceae bacterium]